MSKILAIVFRKAADGEFGEGVKRFYWWWAGKKTWTAVILAAVAFGLERAAAIGSCPSCGIWASYIYAAAAALGTVGLVDGAVRIDPPNPPISGRE